MLLRVNADNPADTAAATQLVTFIATLRDADPTARRGSTAGEHSPLLMRRRGRQRSSGLSRQDSWLQIELVSTTRHSNRPSTVSGAMPHQVWAIYGVSRRRR